MVDEGEIVRLYQSGLTTQKVGLAVGISHQRVNRIVRQHGIAIRQKVAKVRCRAKPAHALLTTERRFDRAFVITCGGCWEWTASRNSNGYGKFQANKRTTYAHRYAYERFVGPIAPGLTIDHLCRNRACVNPAHLEPVTLLENVRRRPRTSHPLPHPTEAAK